ncbi:hypothetical protein PV11_09212 [Exophiala sideris]|uniref:Uncharacterized protein n=1 Tax=Exophiala sideris TaxID=1016849 RepID=A0A0D1VN24_9EURO|nr:hypothetical protein PV11_09212 [Exophiala sideris]
MKMTGQTGVSFEDLLARGPSLDPPRTFRRKRYKRGTEEGGVSLWFEGYACATGVMPASLVKWTACSASEADPATKSAETDCRPIGPQPWNSGIKIMIARGTVDADEMADEQGFGQSGVDEGK